MSWAEPDNGNIETEENPDPEEDSDLPQRLQESEESLEARREEEEPEEDSGIIHLEESVDAHNVVHLNEGSNDFVAAAHANCEVADLDIDQVGDITRDITSPGVQARNCAGENVSDLLCAGINEGDSFEQDEELAAPECETETRHEACSESDRQLYHLQEGLSHQHSHVAALPDCSKANQPYKDGEVRQENSIVCQKSYADEISDAHECLQPNHDTSQDFRGNTEVSNNLEDAPEAEVGDILFEKRTSLQEDESGFSAAQAVPSLDLQPSIITPILGEEGTVSNTDGAVARIYNDESMEIVSSDSGDQDLQAPECDRETKHYQMSPDCYQEYSQQNVSVPLNEQVASSNNLDGLQTTPSQGSLQVSDNDSSTLGACLSHIPLQEGVQSTTQNSRVSNSVDCGGHYPSETSGGGDEEKSNASLSSAPEQSADMNPSPLSEVTLPVGDCNPNQLTDGCEEWAQLQPASPGSHPNSTTDSISMHENVMSGDLNTTISAPSQVNVNNDASRPPSAAPLTVIEQQHNPISKDSSQSHSTHSSSEDSTPNKSLSASPQTAATVVLSQDVDSDSIQRQLALALQSDEEDDILHELDIELLSQTARTRSPQKSMHSPKSRLHSHENLDANGLQPSFDIRQLREHNRQLLEQLRIRDDEIVKLTQDKEAQKAELTQVRAEIDELNQRLSSHPSAENLYLPQIKELEKAIVQQECEIKTLREKLMSHDSAAKRAVITLQNELKSRVDQVTKLYEECLKEKDMMVVKFAEAEAKTMDAKRQVERSEAKMKEALKDRENMSIAFKAAKADKQKVVFNFEAKCVEIGNLHKELEKLKEAVSSCDYRIKWFQNKLKDELESHKETKSNLEKTMVKLKEAREETEIIRKECQAIVKRYQESEEIKSNSLDKELKMKETELRTQMQEKNDTEEIHQMTKRELDSLKAQHKDIIEEAKTYKDKVRCLEEERQQNHKMIENYQEIMQRQKTNNVELKAKVTALSALEENYKRAQEMIQTLDKDMAEMKETNRDLQKDMESCRERESKMLTLQSELSRTNALLRSENTNLSNKTSSLTGEVEQLRMEVQELETTVKDLSDKYEEAKVKRKEEMDKISTVLAERTKECNEFKQKWEDEMDNTKTLKRRHANNVKDLTRQLHQVKKRLESLEGKGDANSMGSRTNSNGSLNSLENSGAHPPSVHQPPVQEFPVITEQVEVDKQVLIERIVRLQKSHARKNEKLEFLGEHIQQLLEEIKKKNKIIQCYALREEAGALSSEDMDANKDNVNPLYKAEAQKEIQTLLARKGGIMASVYSVHQQDGSMTLELSLQINRKLQAVLEDTLLKNITLKENLDTLGEEIARLSQENRQLQLRLQEIEQQH